MAGAPRASTVDERQSHSARREWHSHERPRSESKCCPTRRQRHLQRRCDGRRGEYRIEEEFSGGSLGYSFNSPSTGMHAPIRTVNTNYGVTLAQSQDRIHHRQAGEYSDGSALAESRGPPELFGIGAGVDPSGTTLTFFPIPQHLMSVRPLTLRVRRPQSLFAVGTPGAQYFGTICFLTAQQNLVLKDGNVPLSSVFASITPGAYGGRRPVRESPDQCGQLQPQSVSGQRLLRSAGPVRQCAQ